MPNIEARQTFAAAATPVEITSALGPQLEYWVACHNPAPLGGETAYLCASAADTNLTALDIPPQYNTLSGPFTTLPFLYAANSQNVYVTLIGLDQPSNKAFEHQRTAVTSNSGVGLKEWSKTVTHADLTAAAVTEVETWDDFPANVLISHCWVELNTCFSGVLAAVALEVGDTADPNGLFSSTSVFTGASTTTPLVAAGVEATLHAEAAFVPEALFTGNANLVGLTAGSVTIHIAYYPMPLLT